jgi:hypothetical protein
MKKGLSKIGLLIAVFAIGSVMISCSGGKSTPARATLAFTDNIEKGNFDAAVNLMQGANDATAEEKEKLKSFMSESSKEMKEKGGIKDKEILKETLSKDGNTATVEMRITYGDGTTDASDTKLIKTDDGWKIRIEK